MKDDVISDNFDRRAADITDEIESLRRDMRDLGFHENEMDRVFAFIVYRALERNYDADVARFILYRIGKGVTVLDAYEDGLTGGCAPIRGELTTLNPKKFFKSKNWLPNTKESAR